MSVEAAFHGDPRFAALGDQFSDVVEPAAFPAHILRWRNDEAASTIGLNTLSDAQWVAHFGKFEPLPGIGQRPRAMRYHGHQFRSYNPQLGDGRGFLLGQMRDDQGRLLDFGTKGSGQTPWSRQGDGRLTLKGGVREILAASLLDAYGVYTSQAFSLIETGEDLARNDEPSPTRSAVLVRLQHSHVRFGTFQRLAFLEQPENLMALVDHCVDCYYPALASLEGPARVAAFLRETSLATASMVASWMAAGFVHGVLNTDNMNVTGQSFDYGPWRFLPYADANFTAAYFDHQGLYAYGRQPEAGLWNLKQLAGALTSICPVGDLTDAVRAYPTAFAAAQIKAMCARLGVLPRDDAEANRNMLDAMLAFMAQTGISWDGFFFDWFCGTRSQVRALSSPRAALYQGQVFDTWRTLLEDFGADRPQRLNQAYFARSEPVTLVIDEVEALWEPIARDDDWRMFHEKIAGIKLVKSIYNPSITG